MTEVQAAIARSRKLYKSKGFRGAYVAGAQAGLQGRGEEACPYARDASWARTWRRAWIRGFQSTC